MIAVGDGANDIPMLKLAGLGVATLTNVAPSFNNGSPIFRNLPPIFSNVCPT